MKGRLLFEAPSSADLVALAEEAVHRFHLADSVSDLASRFEHDWHNPAAFRADPRLEIAFNFVFASWHIKLDHTRAIADLRRGFPFIAFRLFSLNSCRLAQARNGELYTSEEALPVLPLKGCPANVCKCHLSGISHSQAERERLVIRR